MTTSSSRAAYRTATASVVVCCSPSATGPTWSNYAGANFGAAIEAMHGSRPAVSTDLNGAAAPTGGGHHDGGAARAATARRLIRPSSTG